ncbi:MAG: polysaccharide pyruvyl transferase family protein [Lachnospiraceae bacterium]|nr:polysaccharide pyruvyl transferase family protein [Lachnospiraceae bacterium]
MKIDLITLHAVKNYGSVLQTLATQKIFESYGYEVEVINYIREDCLDKNLLQYWCGKNPVKRVAMYPTIKRWDTVFNKFIREHFKLTDKVYTYEEDFVDFPLTADLYCTGSDQVWNSGWNGGIEKALFLNFVPESKYKFAYSASFGKKELSEEEVAATKPYIDQYKYISVREDYAKTILEKQYGYTNCCHVVDPTLAYDGDFWRGFAPKSKRKGDYILIYNLNRSKAFDEYAVKLSKKTGLPLVRLCTRYDQFYRPGKSVLVPEVFEFITLIDNAKYVLTDSFHATAFSLNLNTEPICIYPAEYGGRLESILRMTNSLQKHVENYDDFDVVNRSVDFDEVNRALSEQRARIREFLEAVFEDFEKNNGACYE